MALTAEQALAEYYERREVAEKRRRERKDGLIPWVDYEPLVWKSIHPSQLPSSSFTEAVKVAEKELLQAMKNELWGADPFLKQVKSAFNS